MAAAVAHLWGGEGWGEKWGSQDTREGMLGGGPWWREVQAVAAAVARLRGRVRWGEKWGSEDTREGMQVMGDGGEVQAVAAAVARLQDRGAGGWCLKDGWVVEGWVITSPGWATPPAPSGGAWQACPGPKHVIYKYQNLGQCGLMCSKNYTRYTRNTCSFARATPPAP